MTRQDARIINPARPPANVVSARNWHFQYLAERMRPDEIEHWMAVTGATSYDADTCAAAAIASGGMKVAIVDKDGLPYIAGGYLEPSPGIFEGWAIGSMDGWGSQWRTITKTARWLVGNAFTHLGARRVFVTTLASRTLACDWYEKGLGMQREGVARMAGAQGQDMVTYSRITA